MDYQIKTVKLADITVANNHRVDASLRVMEMANSIRDMGGLTDPIVVWNNPETKSLEAVCGHRRILGCQEVETTTPDVFRELFPEGIPVMVRSDITTAAEAAIAKADHGTQVTLSFKCERDRAVGDMLDKRIAEKDITNRNEGLFLKWARPGSTAKRDKIKVLKEDPIKNRKALRTLIHETFKGQYQQAKAVWDNPTKVRACMEFLEAGQPLPKGIKCPPKLVYKDCVELAQALAEDCKDLGKDNLPKYSKGNPGPKWNKLWKELMEAKPLETTNPKRMTAKEMLNQISTGVWSSKGFQKVTQQHSGEKGVEGLTEADAMLFNAELVKTHDPKAWKAFLAAAEAVKAKARDGELSS